MGAGGGPRERSRSTRRVPSGGARWTRAGAGIHALIIAVARIGSEQSSPRCASFSLTCEPRDISGGEGRRRGRLAGAGRPPGRPAERGKGMRLEGKVALMTGGAHGMGASEAALFAREGAKVVVADLLEVDGQQVVGAIGASGGEARFVRLDVTSEDDWSEAVAATVAAFGKLDTLVNNAGISGGIDPDVMSTKAYDRLMDVNAKGVFLGMKYAIPAMQKAGGGSIVNISSISGIVGQDMIHMGYNASKGAVRAITKSAAVQYAGDGIRVNSVHPGFMPPMLTSRATADPELRARWLKAVPMKRAGRPEEVAHAVLFLASDEASYITGAELVV